MKKVLLVAIMVLNCAFTYAQKVIDTLNVGPYKVIYRGKDDYEYDFENQDENLYDFFDLKRDTLWETKMDTIRDTVYIQPVESQILDTGKVISQETNIQTTEPKKLGFQLGLFCEGGTYRSARFSMAFGIDGTMKHRVANKTYLSYGLSFGYAAVTTVALKEDLIEIGIPLAIEWNDLNDKNATLYGGVGFVPTYYLTANARYISDQEVENPKTYSGIYIAPRLDFGVYIPVGKPIIKLGLTWRYKINCSTKEYDVYREVIGRSFLGFNFGLIF